MPHYYANSNAQPNDDHEVHQLNCNFLPHERNRIYLGEFSSCYPAVLAAKRHYWQSNGCYFCCNPCHTG